jgi:hypothetical protein
VTFKERRSQNVEKPDEVIYGWLFAILWALEPPVPTTMSWGFFLSGAGHLYFFVYKTTISDNNAMLAKKF